MEKVKSTRHKEFISYAGFPLEHFKTYMYILN